MTATEIADPSVAARPDDTVTVRLSESLDPGAIAEQRPPAAGICGKASIDDVVRRCDPFPTAHA